MATLQEIRAKLAEQEKKTSGGGTVSDNAIFPFWNIPEGTTSTIRFLPDSDENNTFFWVERAMIKLPFPGIKGAADTKPTLVQVPCMEMFNEPCPVLAEVRTWFKDPALEDMHFALIRVIDKTRMLDQDMIRLQQKVNVVLEYKATQKILEQDKMKAALEKQEGKKK